MAEELFKLVPNILSTSNCLHIALLVYLRSMAIAKPLQYEDIHRYHHFISPVIIWLLSIVVNLFPPIALCFYNPLRLVFVYIVLHGGHTIPIIYIVWRYAKMAQIINKRNEVQRRISEVTEDKNRKRLNTKLSTNMITGVAVCLVIFYLPYLVWWQYARTRDWMDISGQRLDPKTPEVH